MNISKILYGGDYNPDQWLNHPEVLDADIDMMKIAKVNTVTLGMFSWAKLEPKEGVYEFDWLETIINRLYDNGISTILGTPSGSRPRWFAKNYPEVLRVDENRVKQLYGMRHNHCYTSPKYREKVFQINKKLAHRFDANPAVILWHISNEYGGECHCTLCQNAFRQWLRKKYNTIDEVNWRWNTSFWGHDYSSFDEIESPSPIGEESIDGLVLDWKRFVTDQTVDFMNNEIEAIKSVGGKKPVTTNMMYDYKPLNYHKFADSLDIISWDSYPYWGKGHNYEIALNTGMQHDLMRSLKKKPFLLMESSPGATNWQPVSKLKRPGILSAQSYQAIAHGSDSVLYFQIRKGRGGAEKFHGAMIDHSGKKTDRTFIECCEVGNGIEAISDVLGSNISSEVAIVYDWENWWAMENAQGPRNLGLNYHEVVSKPYRALRKQGIDVDIIDMTQELGEYKLLIAPMLYMFRGDFQDKVRSFVKSGGTFILTYWSGIVDENDLCFLGGTPGNLQDVMGIRTTDVDGLYDDDVNYMIPNNEDISAFAQDRKYQIHNLCQLVELTGAKPIMIFEGDFYANTPAATVNHYGLGYTYYIGGDVEQAFYDDLLSSIIKESGLSNRYILNIPSGVEVTSRYTSDYTYVFLQNFSTKRSCINIKRGTLFFSDQSMESIGKSVDQYELKSLETIIMRY